MYSPASFAILFGALVAVVHATSSFVQPPAAGPASNYRDNPHYDVGESVDIQWTTDLEFQDLYLWQEYPEAGGGNFFFLKLLENVRYTSLIWKVSFDGFSTNVTKGEEAIFFLAVYNASATAYDTASHYFNVSVPDTTTSATTATITPTASPTDHGTAEPTTTAASSETTSADKGSDDNDGEKKKDSGLSTGATAGIAVGATLGGLAIIGAIGFFLWRRRRNAPGDASGQYDPASQQPPPPVQEYYKPVPPPQSEGQSSELPGSTWTHATHPQTNVTGPGGLYEAP